MGELRGTNYRQSKQTKNIWQNKKVYGPPILLGGHAVDFVSQKHFWTEPTKPFTYNQTCFQGLDGFTMSDGTVASACPSAHQAGNTKSSKCNKSSNVIKENFWSGLIWSDFDPSMTLNEIHEGETLQCQIKTVLQLCLSARGTKQTHPCEHGPAQGFSLLKRPPLLALGSGSWFV